MKKALITGVTGQDGSYLSEFLLEKGSDDKYGARPLRRAILTNVEDVLAERILEGKVHAGDSVTLGVKDGALRFQVSKPRVK